MRKTRFLSLHQSRSIRRVFLRLIGTTINLVNEHFPFLLLINQREEDLMLELEDFHSFLKVEKRLTMVEQNQRAEDQFSGRQSFDFDSLLVELKRQQQQYDFFDRNTNTKEMSKIFSLRSTILLLVTSNIEQRERFSMDHLEHRHQTMEVWRSNLLLMLERVQQEEEQIEIQLNVFLSKKNKFERRNVEKES